MQQPPQRPHKRNYMIYSSEHGLVHAKALIKIGGSFYLAVPLEWVRAFLDEDEPYIGLTELEAEPGFVIRPISPELKAGELTPDNSE